MLNLKRGACSIFILVDRNGNRKEYNRVAGIILVTQGLCICTRLVWKRLWIVALGNALSKLPATQSVFVKFTSQYFTLKYSNKIFILVSVLLTLALITSQILPWYYEYGKNRSVQAKCLPKLEDAPGYFHIFYPNFQANVCSLEQ